MTSQTQEFVVSSLASTVQSRLLSSDCSSSCVQYDKDLKLLLTARYFMPPAAERAQQRVVASRTDELVAANALSRIQVQPAKKVH